MESNHFILNSFEDKRSLVESLSKRILTNLNSAINEKGYATMALSGGSTPKKLFASLSNIDFPWEKVCVTLVDERWVDASSDASNERLIRENLMQNLAKELTFIPLKNSAISAKEGVTKLEETLESSCDALDVVILGMGADAHTASFFPHSRELEFALSTENLCCATTASVEPKERMTLSRSFLLKTKNLILHIEGENKKDVFEKATESSNFSSMPIISMMQQTKPILEVYYAD